MGLLVQSEVARRRANKGFTLIELLVVVSMLGIMSAVGYLSMAKLQTSTETQTSLDRLMSSIRTQRIYAMLGNSTTGTKAMPQGIYFAPGTGTYTLFSCDALQDCSYIPYKSTNIVDTMEKSTAFSIVSLPDNQIIFTPYSGEVASYENDRNSVVVRNQYDNTEIILRISLMGTIESSQQL